MSLRLRLSAAALLFLVLTVTPAGAGATVSHGTVLRSVPGSALPMLRGATRLAATPSTTPIDVTVAMQPRNQALLAWTAAHSHDHPLSVAQLRALFVPTSAQRARVVGYMRANGMALRSSGLLSLTFHGSATAASHAFHVGLSTYRGANGHVFRAPDGAVSLPASIRPLVSSVAGLDTALRLHSYARRRATVLPHTAVPAPTCAGPGNAQANFGGYLPAQLDQAYGNDNLITGGSDGSGERIALIEFTNYSPTDVGTYQTCFGLTGVPVTPHPIDGGNSSMGGAIEAELDIDVALGGAPGLDGVDVYKAPNNLAEIIPMVDAIINSGNTFIISDSWGICEDYIPPSFMKSESDEFELAAAAGISYFSATGDSGSSDCKPLNKNDTRLITDDPASQPFVTGVGGTSLWDPTSGSNSDAWKYGGGGVSEIWPAPAYQSGFSKGGAIDNGSKCGNIGGLCRQVPDISLDADPNNGYIIYCTVTVAGCFTQAKWLPWGGTSAAAPMMAAIAADANTYSLAHGGSRMGFANPFLYSDSGMFYDITSGNNSINGSGLYPAGGGYDLATGLGSPLATTVATDLAAYSPAAVTRTGPMSLAVTAPAAARTIHYGQSVTLSGTLNGPGPTPIANRRVDIELTEGAYIYLYKAETDVNGNWSVTIGKGFRRNTHWKAIFPGSDTEEGAVAPGPPVYVIPALGNSAPTSASRGAKFTVKGTSTPNMHGVKVTLQVRRSKSGRWRSVTSVAVSKRGTYAHQLVYTTSGPVYTRWTYSGGKTHAWMSALSRTRTTSIH